MVRLHYLPPSEQVCESFVPFRYIGFPLIEYFVSRFPYLSRENWVSIIQNGRVKVNAEPASLELILKEHDLIVTRLGKRLEPPANREINILYEDQRIRVFNKNAPIPVHPSGRYYKNSMTELLRGVYPGETLRPAQRLDSATTGVLVFAKTKKVASFLMHEFATNQVHKEYLVIVEGLPKEKHFLINRAIGKINGSQRGTGSKAVKPKQSVTEFHWLVSLGKRSLLKAIPHSGRTNQIRVHLATADLPVVNDAVYGKNSLGGAVAPLGLHAYRLRFRCFETLLDIIAPWPEHFQPFITTETRELEP